MGTIARLLHSELVGTSAPVPLSHIAERGEQEIGDLRTLAAGGLPVAPTVVVPAAAEEEFYRLNNLGGRIGVMFGRVDLRDPDDDDIDELAPEAERLVAAHFLLDEFIDRFYEASTDLPQLVRVRRPGESGEVTRKGRRSLLALKRAWSDDWGFERIWARLQGGAPLLPAPRPLLIQPAPLERLQHLEGDANALLARNVELFGDPELGATLVSPAAGREPTRAG
jgi:hypothetical protein